jgi:hypothetical protein
MKKLLFLLPLFLLTGCDNGFHALQVGAVNEHGDPIYHSYFADESVVYKCNEVSGKKICYDENL